MSDRFRIPENTKRPRIQRTVYVHDMERARSLAGEVVQCLGQNAFLERYRPSRLDDVAGDHESKAQDEELAHQGWESCPLHYFYCGESGCGGKTTLARILAAAAVCTQSELRPARSMRSRRLHMQSRAAPLGPSYLGRGTT